MKWSIGPWFSHSTRVSHTLVLFLKLRDDLTDRRARRVERVIITSRLPSAQQQWQRAAKVWHERETHPSHRCKNHQNRSVWNQLSSVIHSFEPWVRKRTWTEMWLSLSSHSPKRNTQTVGTKRRQDKQIHAGTLTVGRRAVIGLLRYYNVRLIVGYKSLCCRFVVRQNQTKKTYQNVMWWTSWQTDTNTLK